MQKFQMFYQKNLDLVYRSVYRSVRNREEAEDLTSHIFLKVFCLIDWERNPGAVKYWLFQVVRTTLADYWRTRSHDSTCSLEELLEAGWDSVVEEPMRVSNSTVEHVQHLLEALPNRYREVLICRFLLDLSIRGTALQMGITEANVKVLQFRALRYAAALEYIAES